MSASLTSRLLSLVGELYGKTVLEINKINRILKMLAKEYGFDEVYCSAVFGNGEAIYTKVENTQRARIVRAIKEIA